MMRLTLSKRLATGILTCAAIFTWNCAPSNARYYQGIPVNLNVKKGIGGGISSVVQIDDAKNLEHPAIVILARGLAAENEGYLHCNGNRYDLPVVVGGLRGKIVIPLQPEHVRNGKNEIRFFNGTGGDGYLVLDLRIESAQENTAGVTGWTYQRLSAGGVPETIRAFDFLMDYQGRYDRAESGVPAWTQRGKVRHMRFDNDPLFYASCYWWLHGKQKDAMENIYTKYADRVIEICREGSINCVLVRWSCGLSLSFEEEWRKQCAKLIKKFHENGIRVGVYQSASTVFYDEMFKNEPESRNWVRRNAREEPVVVGWNPRMYVGDIRNDAFRKYILKRAELAIDAGVDELYYDNPAGEIGDLATLFNDIRELINKKGKNLSVYTNLWGTLLIEDVCDITKSESFREPGVWDGVWTHNMGQVRFNYGVGEAWKPFRAKYGKGGIHVTGQGGEYIAGGGKVDGMTLGWIRPIAEAAAFQAHFSIAENNNIFETRLILQDDEEVLKTWKDVGRYNRFLEKNENCYMDVKTVSRIGIPVPPDWHWERDFFNALSEMNVIYDILPLPKIDEHTLAKYKLLLIPNVPWVSEDIMRHIQQYKKHGGKVYTVGSSVNLQKIADIRSEKNLCKNIRHENMKEEFLDNCRKILGTPLIQIENARFVAANITRKTEPDRIILHFLNYTEHQENISVKVNLEGIAGIVDTENIRLLSPDSVPMELKGLSVEGGIIVFTIPELETYSIVIMDY